MEPSENSNEKIENDSSSIMDSEREPFIFYLEYTFGWTISRTPGERPKYLIRSKNSIDTMIMYHSLLKYYGERFEIKNGSLEDCMTEVANYLEIEGFQLIPLIRDISHLRMKHCTQSGKMLSK
jgi:hypothetical protein